VSRSRAPERGPVPLPAVTDSYILFGVGARVAGDAFTRYVADQNLELNDEAGLRDASARLETEHTKLQREISDLQSQAQSDFAAVKDRANTKQAELDKSGAVARPSGRAFDIAALRQKLKSNEEDKALLSRYYGQASGSSRLLRDYDLLQALARNFGDALSISTMPLTVRL